MESPTISTKTERIAQLARKFHDRPLTPLSHFIDIDWLKEAYRRTRKDAAPGVDGQTLAEYADGLEGNLELLKDRAKSGRYRAPAVRRVHLPKEDGKTRPIGIPTVEDKILQRAVAMVLEPIYEQEFLDCSYGFRPGRSAHDALEVVWQQTMGMKGGWVLEVDIESFFDSVDQGKLQEIFRRRVGDGVLVRLIGKWLNAGVMEEGRVHRPKAGTPQGGVISPLLANIYLHEVLDVWFAGEVKKRLSGRSCLVRYADDIVLLFERKEDAQRVMAVLPKRFGKYGLRLHPEKTKLVAFSQPDRNDGPPSGRPGSFDLLGFTHFWGKSQKGNWVVKRKTSRKRLSRTLKSINQWCRAHRHDAVREQQQKLAAKLRGHYEYFGIRGNSDALASLQYWVRGMWKKWLGRRNNRHLTWQRFEAIHRAFPLPPPRISHSY